MKTLSDAILLATYLHREQKDKVGKPYILHVLRVMMNPILTTEAEQIAAALHDTVEDCGVTFEGLLAEGYSEEVVEALRFLTKRPEEEDDYERFIDRILTGPVIARRVKLADLMDNADRSRITTPDEWDVRRFEKYERAIKRIRESPGTHPGNHVRPGGTI